MITTTTTWSAVMRRLVDGADVPLESLYEAATLAAKADDRLLTSQWLSVVAELKRRAAAGPLDGSWHWIAWAIGATADFVEGIEAATGEALPWVK
jgi:hypothetical protein